MRKLKSYSQIVCVAFIGLNLSACSLTKHAAMDFVPQSAMSLIQEDLQKGGDNYHEQAKPISVSSMLSSLLGLKEDDVQRPNVNTQATRKEISTVAFSELEKAAPLPSRKPLREEAIEFTLDETAQKQLKAQFASIDTADKQAVILVGPVGQSDDMEMASLQAMAKASAIGNALRADFRDVKIKFDPLQPTGTMKILIEGGKA